MTHYYNENDPKAAAWIRQLIAAKLVPDGYVDERSITEVQANDLTQYTQCHFFCGIAGWPLALQLSGWPEDRQVWTGSCPCQPFSGAGKRKGTADARHLWPEMFRLVRECRPSTVIGEQVEAAVRLGWLDGVFADLEGEGYACGSAVLGAHSVGAPHIRQRLYWVADDQNQRSGEFGELAKEKAHPIPEISRNWDRLRLPGSDRAIRRLADLQQPELEGFAGDGDDRDQPGRIDSGAAGSVAEGCATGPWSDFDIIRCTDGKTRRIPRRPEPGFQSLVDGFSDDVAAGWRQSNGSIHPLAKGVKGRVGLLRGAGNAIVPELAAEFIKATGLI